MTIDCDVHCAPASVSELFPYLDRYWVDFLTEARYSLPTEPFLAAYPPGGAITATPAVRAATQEAATQFDVVREHALDRVDAQFAVLNCLSGFDSLRHSYLSAALHTAVNDWIAREWLDCDPRLRASVVVPTLDVDLAVEEIERRAADPRVVQVLLPIRSYELYGRRRYLPLLEAAVRHDLVVGLHAWGMSGLPPTPSGFPQRYLEDYLLNTTVAQSQLVSLVTEGAFERLPDLRVSVIECGFAWLPGLLWHLDKDWKGIRREVPWLNRRPSEYIRERVRFTLEPAQMPPSASQIRDVLGMLGSPELLMYSTDHPHDHGPSAQRLLDVLTDDERDAVLSGNASAHYRLDQGPSRPQPGTSTTT